MYDTSNDQVLGAVIDVYLRFYGTAQVEPRSWLGARSKDQGIEVPAGSLAEIVKWTTRSLPMSNS